MRSVLLTPHPDDETLFATFTLLREKPHVVCVFDCGDERRTEFEAAMRTLGIKAPETWGFPEDPWPNWASIREAIRNLGAERLYAPEAGDMGNLHHIGVGHAAADSGIPTVHYLTYTTAGKQTSGNPVPYEPAWIGLKLRALACYESQYAHPSHAPHFMRGLDEFYA